MELGKIIDDNSDDDNTSTNNNHTNKNGEALSKGGILEKVSWLSFIHGWMALKARWLNQHHVLLAENVLNLIWGTLKVCKNLQSENVAKDS